MNKKWLVGIIVAAGAALASAAPAHADITAGSCDGTINGVNVRGRSASKPSDAIDVDAHSKVIVEAISNAVIDGYKIEMSYAGFTWTVATGPSGGNSWQREVDVDKYAKFGAGLYRVRGISTGAGACTGEALIKITGRNPLTTVAGAASAVLAAGGLAGIGFGARGAGRRVLRAGLDQSRNYQIFQEGAQPTDRVTAIADSFSSASSPADYVDALTNYANAGATPHEMALVSQVGGPVHQHIASIVGGA